MQQALSSLEVSNSLQHSTSDSDSPIVPPHFSESSSTIVALSQPYPSSSQSQTTKMARVFLDYNATTPVEPAVLQALLPYLGQQFGNASSSYALGQQANKAVANARAQVASMLGATDSSEVVFLSGGTESINYALKGAAMAARRESGRSHIVTSCVEHVAVLETCKWLATQDFQVTYLPVDRFGCVRVQDVLDALTPETCVVSVMLANNEVGSLQPVADISRTVRRYVDEEHGLPIAVHTDASQAIGKVRVNVQDLGIDLLTIAGHKLYAPKGVGALYIREGTHVDALIHGASQENGRRGGTENVALVVALGEACALVEQNLHEYAVVMHESRAFLLEQIQKHCSLTNVSYQVNGHPELSLPNTLSISFENINAPRILDCK
jgi:cysteine desulfurase